MKNQPPTVLVESGSLQSILVDGEPSILLPSPSRQLDSRRSDKTLLISLELSKEFRDSASIESKSTQFFIHMYIGVAVTLERMASHHRLASPTLPRLLINSTLYLHLSTSPRAEHLAAPRQTFGVMLVEKKLLLLVNSPPKP